jgi:hypothetical protein
MANKTILDGQKFMAALDEVAVKGSPLIVTMGLETGQRSTYHAETFK